MLPISTIAGKLGIPDEYILPYGEQSAKVRLCVEALRQQIQASERRERDQEEPKLT
ncbi:MAG: Formate--tetrahydrofolate ligase [Pseudomonadota bacterium]